MAFSLQQHPDQDIASAAISSALTVAKPSLGQLLICGVGLQSSVLPVPSVTDNGSAGWTAFHSASNFFGSAVGIMYYKVANATDVSSLTTTTFSWTNGADVSGGACFLDEYHGFVGTPTLDLNPALVTSSTSVTETVTGGVAAHATELAIGAIFMTGAGGASTGANNTYSPNNGINTSAWTVTLSSQDTHINIYRTWAAPTATPATASQWITTWTTAHANVAWAATFYDRTTSPSAGLLAALLG